MFAPLQAVFAGENVVLLLPGFDNSAPPDSKPRNVKVLCDMIGISDEEPRPVV